MTLNIRHFFDPGTSTLTYVVYDSDSKDAVIIDPVWDYDAATGKLSMHSFETVLSFIKEHDLHPHFVLETHAHADHISSSQLFKKHFPKIKVAIGKRITEVQQIFGKTFNLKDLDTTGKDFDRLLSENEEFTAGTIAIKYFQTPGHTPACGCYLMGDALFTGDVIFMPDSGTGRCDFPGGSAESLYDSVTQKIYNLPDKTRIFVGHDYQPQGRDLKFQTTVGEQKRDNIQLKHDMAREDFLRFRKERDATLSAPKLLLPSIQVNIQAGHLPSPESNGQRYLKIPLS